MGHMKLQPDPPLPGHRLEVLHEEQEIRQRISDLSEEDIAALIAESVAST